jgi:glucose/arabinose dehydrogenase
LLFRSADPYGNHNGGMLAFAPNGRLFFTMGDGGAGGDPENRSQNPRSRFGKLLSINVATKGLRMEALGLRNAWRFSFDRANGDLYIGDVGQGNWEEIDFRARSAIGRLANYGWKAFEGRTRYTNTPLGPGQLVDPVYVFSHVDNNCSVTGGFVYRGRTVAAAVGRYFFGDYCSGIVWSLRMANGQATDVRREPFRVDSLTSFGEDAAGELYLGTGDGRIFRLGA